MNLQPQNLAANGYVLLNKLDHNQIAPFIRTYLKKRNKFSLLYILSNLLVFVLAGYLFTYQTHQPGYSFERHFTHFAYGIALAFILVPLHEYIHVLAYKSQGALNTSYGANLKRFYFTAMADKFVASKREFFIIALAPFAAISTGLLICILLVHPAWRLTIAGILLTHTAMCSGDFGLLSFFEYHKQKEVVTYDDVEGKISYFYTKPNITAS